MAVYVSANSLSSYGIRVRSLKLSTLVISKLVDAITVAVVDAEERVDGSLVEILRLKFGQDIMAEIWLIFFWAKSLFRLFAHVLFNIL